MNKKYKIFQRKDVSCLDIETEEDIQNFGWISVFLNCDMKYDLDSFKNVINMIDRATQEEVKDLYWGGNATFAEFYEKECIVESIFDSDDEEESKDKCMIDIFEFREIVISWFEERTKIKYNSNEISKNKFDEINELISSFRK